MATTGVEASRVTGYAEDTVAVWGAPIAGCVHVECTGLPLDHVVKPSHLFGPMPVM